MKLVFPVDQYKKLRAYVDSIKYEISGLGKVSIVDDDILVEDIRIFEQKVTGGNTILNKDALAKFYDDLMKADEDLGKWKLWWHSHANMEASWSSVDEATIEDFDNQMPKDNWIVSLVTNRSAKTLIRVDIFQPIRVTIEDIDWTLSFEDKKLAEKIQDEITEKVTIFVPPGNNSKKKVTSWPAKKVHLPTSTFGNPGINESLGEVLNQ